MRNAVPLLSARLVPEAPGICARLVVRCDWCEEDHSHGAAPGPRVAHCTCADSPYRMMGYELRESRNADLATWAPEALYHGQRRLREDLARLAPRYRSTLLASVLGARPGRHFDKRFGRARISVFADSWIIDPDAIPTSAELQSRYAPQRSVRMGRDFITLLAALYGMARGIVGVRLLEAASGATFDAEGKRTIAAAIEDAYARKAEGQDGRP